MRLLCVISRPSIFEDASAMLWVYWLRSTMWRRLAMGIFGFEITALNATPSWIVCILRCDSHIEMKKEVSLLELKLEEKRRKLQALIAQVRIDFSCWTAEKAKGNGSTAAKLHFHIAHLRRVLDQSGHSLGSRRERSFIPFHFCTWVYLFGSAIFGWAWKLSAERRLCAVYVGLEWDYED